jgi:hypothetical protein
MCYNHSLVMVASSVNHHIYDVAAHTSIFYSTSISSHSIVYDGIDGCLTEPIQQDHHPGPGFRPGFIPLQLLGLHSGLDSFRFSTITIQVEQPTIHCRQNSAHNPLQAALYSSISASGSPLLSASTANSEPGTARSLKACPSPSLC